MLSSYLRQLFQKKKVICDNSTLELAVALEKEISCNADETLNPIWDSLNLDLKTNSLIIMPFIL